MKDDGARRRHSGGLAVCKETSAAEESGNVELNTNSMSLGFPDCLPLLFLSVTVTPIIMAVYPSCTLGLIIFSPCISPSLCLSPLLTHYIDWHEPISKTLISTKPQGTHCLQLFSCLTQSCCAVRTHNDTQEWDPWCYLNIINISWR